MNIYKKLTVVGLLLAICMTSSAYTERNLLQHAANKQSLQAALVMNQSWVPYPAYADRASWDKLLGDSKDACIARGEKYLKYEWKVIKATDYIEYEKSGDRNIMQNPNSANNNAISALMLAELAEGKGRFIPQLVNGAFFTCEKTSWVLSAHLASYQLSHKALPDYDDVVIDLGSGETGAMLSWAYYFFHEEFDKVTPQISKRLKYEILKRQMDAYMNTNRYWWMAIDYKPGMMINNWNPWCNCNVLQSFLLLENDPQKLADAVYRTMMSVDKYLNYVKADGGCEEGPSYWDAAPGQLLDYLQLLSMATGGKVSIFNDPMVKRMGEYIARSYVGNDWVVNFADASAKGGGNAPLIYRYGKAVNSPLMTGFATYLDKRNDKTEKDGKYLSNGTAVFRMLQTLSVKNELMQSQQKFESPLYSWYPETQFCYMSNKSGLFVATKGGNNNESHNHNDVGTFSVYLNTIPILIDAGVGTYTRQTFSSERYNIWTMQSNYHNLPMINGTPQNFGGEYKASGANFSPSSMTYSANIATAYPKEAEVSSWVRSCVLKKGEVVVKDVFTLKSAKKYNQVNFLTWGDVDISRPGVVIISVQGQKASLQYEKDKFEIHKETVKLTDPRLSNVWGSEVYRVVLTSRQLDTNGSYTYIIKSVK